MEGVRKVIVTGSNKGIGYGIFTGLLQLPEKLELILTSRSEESGFKAIEDFKSKFPSKAANIHFEMLNLLEDECIDDFVNRIATKYGKVDALINNAGAASSGPAINKDIINMTLGTNYFGTMRLTNLFLEKDIIQPNGKIIFVSSCAGLLSLLKSKNPDLLEICSKYKDGKMTEKDVEDLARRFSEEILIEGKKDFWYSNTYASSKMFVNMHAYILSRRPEVLDRKIQVYSCHPGFVDTDMTKGRGAPLNIYQGAETPLYLFNLPNHLNMDLQGQYFSEKKVVDIVNAPRPF